MPSESELAVSLNCVRHVAVCSMLWSTFVLFCLCFLPKDVNILNFMLDLSNDGCCSVEKASELLIQGSIVHMSKEVRD